MLCFDVFLNFVCFIQFGGRSSDYKATGNVYILFQYPAMISNNTNLKIRIKIFERKIEKKQGVPLAFLKILTKKIFLNFQVISIEIY